VNGKGVIRLSNNGLCMCSKDMHVHKYQRELKLISTYYIYILQDKHKPYGTL
jgi:hypothetical protein